MNFSYGKSLADKQKVAFDRTDCYEHTPNMMIFGQAGTGKTWAVVNEIQQVLDNTEDDVIILNAEGFCARDERIKSKIVCIAPFEPDSKWHINPLDIHGYEAYEADKGKRIFEGVKAVAVNLIEEIIKRPTVSYERVIIHDACDRTFKPFLERLERTGEQSNSERNPTLSDIAEELVCNSAALRDNEQLWKSLKDVIKKNRNENNKVMADSVTLYLDELFSRQAYNDLHRDIVAKLPFIKEYFSYKTNMPADRAVQLSWRGVKVESACNLACLYYVWNRLVCNHQNDYRKHLWIYQENADTVFSRATPLPTILGEIYRRCRPYGGIMTLVSQSVADVIRGTDGRVCFDNTSTFLVFGLCSEDARIMLQISGFGTNIAERRENMMCVKNSITGIGTLYREHNWTPVTFRE